MFLLLESCVQRNNQFFEAKELLDGEMLSDTETDLLRVLVTWISTTSHKFSEALNACCCLHFNKE